MTDRDVSLPPPFGPAGGCVPLAVAWRAIRAPELLAGDDGGLYAVACSGWGTGGTWSLTLSCGDWRARLSRPPDECAQVLVPAAVAAAVALCRAAPDRGGLGASVIATHRYPDGGDAPDLIWAGEW